VRVGIYSNIVVDGSRVIFAQGTGSLTVLDLETGQVLLRKRPGRALPYSGRFEQSAHGVLMISYNAIALLDKATFDPIWQAAGCYHAVSDGEYIVSHDGNHTVSCRKVQTGETRWSVDVKGGWHLVAAKGKVLVATPSFASEPFALLVIDMESGQTLLRHEAPPEAQWLQVYFDGALVYMLDGSGNPHSIDAKPSKLTTLDLLGKVGESVDFDSPEIKPQSMTFFDSVFIWRDKYFDRSGRVRSVSERAKAALVELWQQRIPVDESRYDWFIELLPSAVFANISSKDADRETGQLLRLSSAGGSWKAYAPHLEDFGKVSQVIEAPGRLLVGTNAGHVECLDIKTGRPQWLYVFPTVNQTMSYSVPYGMPPYLTKAAHAYRQGIERMTLTRGSIPLAPEFEPATARWSELRASTDYPGRIVVDPTPDDPFSDLYRYLFYVAACAVTPLLGAVALLARFAWKRAFRAALSPQSESRTPVLLSLVVWCFVFSIPTAAGLVLFGRVSHSWTIVLKIFFATAMLGTLIGIVRLLVHHRFGAAALSMLAVLIWCFLTWRPWWFA
jgi:hypothetical protein